MNKIRSITKKYILFILLVSSVQLVGCAKKVDINELTVATGVAIDKVDDEIELTVQVINPVTLSTKPTEASPFIIATEKGKTLFETVRRLAGVFSNRIFFAHFQVLIIGEEAAKDDMEKYLNFFYTDHETQHKFTIMIAKGHTAKETLSIYTMLNKISALAISGKMQSDTKAFGTSKITNIDDAINDVRNEHVGLVLGGIEVIGNAEEGTQSDSIKGSTPKAYTKTSGLAIFKKNKLVGWFNEDESRGYNLILNNIESTVFAITLDNGRKVTVETSKTKTKRQLILVDNKPNFKLTTTVEVSVVEDIGGQITIDESYIKEIKEKTEERVKNLIEQAVNKSKEYNSDIFGFGTMIHAYRPKIWKEIKDDYDNIYPNMHVEINVNVDVIKARY
jgi:spore germination protein KC